jgi:hypothetical protein
MVQSVTPLRKAAEILRGEWVAHLDDDDVFTPDHVETLLDFAIRNDFELVYGISRRETSPGVWENRGHPDFGLGICLPSAALYRSYLNVIPHDLGSWRLGMVHDKHRWRRMYHAGVRTGFLDRVVVSSPLRPGTSRADYLAEDRV